MEAVASVATGRHALDPAVRTVWRVGAGIGAVIAAAAAGLVAWLVSSDAVPTVGVAAGVLVVGGALAWWAPGRWWAAWSYEMGADALELRHGILTRRHSVIPYFRLQHIDLAAGPVERALGVTRLVVHTASAATDAEIPGVATDEAQALREVLLARAGRGDAV